MHATLSPNFNHLYIAVPTAENAVKQITNSATFVIRFFFAVFRHSFHRKRYQMTQQKKAAVNALVRPLLKKVLLNHRRNTRANMRNIPAVQSRDTHPSRIRPINPKLTAQALHLVFGQA